MSPYGAAVCPPVRLGLKGMSEEPPEVVEGIRQCRRLWSAVLFGCVEGFSRVHAPYLVNLGGVGERSGQSGGFGVQGQPVGEGEGMFYLGGELVPTVHVASPLLMGSARAKRLKVGKALQHLA